MESALHNDKIRNKLGIPRDVAEDYVNADKRTNKWQKTELVRKTALLLSTAVLAFMHH